MSPRITPTHWKIQEKIFIADGFVYTRTSGDHRCYEKKGIPRPVIIPKYNEVDDDIIHSHMFLFCVLLTRGLVPQLRDAICGSTRRL